MDKKAYLYIVEAGQFSFEVEIKELLAQSLDRTFGKISAKFCEYNPSNRVVG